MSVQNLFRSKGFISEKRPLTGSFTEAEGRVLITLRTMALWVSSAPFSGAEEAHTIFALGRACLIAQSALFRPASHSEG